MKKLIAIILSLTFLLSVSVFAATTEENFNKLTETNKTVYVTYIPATTETTVYSIDIIWGDLQFEYRDASTGTWNPETLKYDDESSAGWYPKNEATTESIGSNQILVSNRSNAEIHCNASFELNSDYSETFGNITGSFDISSFKLSSAAQTNTAQEKKLSLSLSGPPKILDFTDPTPIGTITLALEAAS